MFETIVRIDLFRSVVENKSNEYCHKYINHTVSGVFFCWHLICKVGNGADYFLIVENVLYCWLEIIPCDTKIALSRNLILKNLYALWLFFSSYFSFDTSFCEFKLQGIHSLTSLKAFFRKAFSSTWVWIQSWVVWQQLFNETRWLLFLRASRKEVKFWAKFFSSAILLPPAQGPGF